MNLQELMDFIGARYVFSPDHYPTLLTQRSPTEIQAFAVNHSILHMVKSLGRIAAECERYDHGGHIDGTAAREATVKMFINTLKIAQELGMTAKQLTEAVPNLMKSK